MEIISQIFGVFLLIYIIAFAFDHMSSSKSMTLSRGVANITAKILMEFGKFLVAIAIPALRQIGEKIVYVSNHYLEKNKPHQPTLLPPADQPPPAPPPDSSDQSAGDTATKDKSSTSSSNPYDTPPEPEIMD